MPAEISLQRAVPDTAERNAVILPPVAAAHLHQGRMAHQVNRHFVDDDKIGLTGIKKRKTLVGVFRVHLVFTACGCAALGAIFRLAVLIVADKHAVAVFLVLIDHLLIHKMRYDFRCNPPCGDEVGIGTLEVFRFERENQRLFFLWHIRFYLTGIALIGFSDQFGDGFTESKVFIPHDKIYRAALFAVRAARPLKEAVAGRKEVQTAAVLDMERLIAAFFCFIAVAPCERNNIHAVGAADFFIGKFPIGDIASPHWLSPLNPYKRKKRFRQFLT